MTSRARPCRARFLAVGALVAVAALLGGCGGTVVPDAATVGNQHVTRADLDSDLSALIGNAKFVSLEQQQSGTTISDGKGKASAAFTANWLSRMIVQTVVDKEFDRRNLKVDPAEVSSAKSTLEQQLGKSVADAFPAGFLDSLAERDARITALDKALGGPNPSEAEIRTYYQQHQSEIEQSCPSDKVVSQIVVKTAAEAQQVLAQLAGGADFATVAQQKSTDQTSAQQGGQLGCLDQLAQSGQPAAVAAAAKGATPGTNVGPVQAADGFHILRVTAGATSYASLHDRIAQILASSADRGVQGFVTKELKAEKVKVDPRYGTFVIDSNGPRVDPPTVPSPPDSRPAASTTTTTTVPAGAGSPVPTTGG